ncbi:MAG: LysR family transcriptional regulator [Clostridium fessum]
MNFQSMEYFAAVAKNRSFTRAADALHITQQTLSAHIAGIERELGCPLLIRHIPLELTYAGRYFCAMQRNLIQNMTVCFTNLAIF